MAKQWLCARNGKAFGPFTCVELKRLAAAGQVLPSDQVRKVGTEEWFAAEELIGLFVRGRAAAKPALAAVPAEEVTLPTRP